MSIFVIKNIIFGYVIATVAVAVACYNGLRVQTSATEVPQHTTASIVQSLSFVFFIDVLLTLAVFI